MYYKYFSYYKKHCGAYNHVFNDMPFLFKLPSIILGLGFVCTILFSVIFMNVKIIPVTLIIVVLLESVILYFFNKKAKEIIKSKYNLISKGKRWNDSAVLDELRSIDKLLISDYLRKTNLSIRRLGKLVNEAKNEMEKAKPKFKVVPAVLGALFTVLWASFYNWLYNHVNNLNDAITITVLGCLIIILIWVVQYIYTCFKEAIKELLFSKEYDLSKAFYRLIDEVHDDKLDLIDKLNEKKKTKIAKPRIKQFYTRINKIKK